MIMSYKSIMNVKCKVMIIIMQKIWLLLVLTRVDQTIIILMRVFLCRNTIDCPWVLVSLKLENRASGLMISRNLFFWESLALL